MKTRLETIALVSLLASGLLCSDIKSVAQVTPNSHPTVAEASAFMEAAEKELLALNVESARGMGAGNLHHRRHGTYCCERERTGYRADYRIGR